MYRHTSDRGRLKSASLHSEQKSAQQLQHLIVQTPPQGLHCYTLVIITKDNDRERTMQVNRHIFLLTMEYSRKAPILHCKLIHYLLRPIFQSHHLSTMCKKCMNFPQIHIEKPCGLLLDNSIQLCQVALILQDSQQSPEQRHRILD